MIFAFGDGEFDTATFELRRAGVAVNVEPQVFDVLVLLVTHRDRVVTKEELLDEVWGNRFVSESALTSRIKDARRAVGDDGHRQAVIRTIHGRGYRFVAPVVEVSAADPGTRPAAETAALPPKPPRTRYARSGRYSIAYQVAGTGPGDLVFIPGFVSNVELQWEFAPMAAFFGRLARGARLIVFDKRGTALSDRVPATEILPLEERMDDVRAVMDAAGSERATLFGISEGGPLALLFAATFPERVERLVLFSSYADRFRDDIAELAATARDAWGSGGVFATLAPSWRHRGDVRFLARYERHSATPDTAAHLIERCGDIDVRPILPSISTPTRIIHRRDDTMFPLPKGRALAEGIPGADLVLLEGRDHLVYVDQEPVLDAVEEFIGGMTPFTEPDRVLTTVLIANVVESTELAQRLGDIARDDLARFRGDEVLTTRDGLLATFDGPARAVRCGQSLQRSAAHRDLPLRIGVHTTEVERIGDDIAGVGVHIGARVAGAATAGEVWTTRTVRDLVAGSGLQFDSRGTHTFEGISEPWELFAALSSATATQIVHSGWVGLDQFFRAVYDRFNARDVDALLVEMTSDVDWPDVRGGRRIAGHEAVRAYWADQWQAIDPHVTPRRVIELPDGRVDVEVHQVIHDRATGDVLVDQVVHHIYELRDGAVAAMHITSTAAERSSARDHAP